MPKIGIHVIARFSSGEFELCAVPRMLGREDRNEDSARYLQSPPWHEAQFGHRKGADWGRLRWLHAFPEKWSFHPLDKRRSSAVCKSDFFFIQVASNNHCAFRKEIIDVRQANLKSRLAMVTPVPVIIHSGPSQAEVKLQPKVIVWSGLVWSGRRRLQHRFS